MIPIMSGLLGLLKTKEMSVKLFGLGFNKTIGSRLSIFWVKPAELFYSA